MTLTHMTFEAFTALSTQSKRIAVYQEIMADRLTPIRVMEHLKAEMQTGTLLESGLQQTEDGRYSYLAFGLMAQLSAYGNQVTQRIGQKIMTRCADPFQVLRELMADFLCDATSHELLRLHGAIGMVTYDAVRLRENIPDRHHIGNNMPDILFNFYHTTLIFDHFKHKLVLAKIVDLEGEKHEIYQSAMRYLQDLIQKITSGLAIDTEKRIERLIEQQPEADINDADFMHLIEQAKDHISAGDAFQIVLSRCFKQSYSAKPLDIYRALRNVSPAPYMFYFPTKYGVMLGASPEKMITVREGQVEINPIAGTRARHGQQDEQRNAEELLSDAKELAEHMMLVDLARNDLGAVCVPGTIKIKELLQVKHFSHVTHLTSTVEGQLRSDQDALDALQATFPAGTVSGAPKIRAMEVIDALETSRRGTYAGAFCRIDALGNFDSCIAIRMAVLRDGIATVRTGAGIVADSNPESEAEETRHKAHGVLAAIALAEGFC